MIAQQVGNEELSIVAVSTLVVAVLAFVLSWMDRRARLGRELHQAEKQTFREAQLLFDDGARSAMRTLAGVEVRIDHQRSLHSFSELDHHQWSAAERIWTSLMCASNDSSVEHIITATNWLDWLGNVLYRPDTGPLRRRWRRWRAQREVLRLVRSLGTPLRRLALIAIVQARTAVHLPDGTPEEVESELRRRFAGLIEVANALHEQQAPHGPDLGVPVKVNGWITTVVDSTPAAVRAAIGPADPSSPADPG